MRERATEREQRPSVFSSKLTSWGSQPEKLAKDQRTCKAAPLEKL